MPRAKLLLMIPLVFPSRTAISSLEAASLETTTSLLCLQMNICLGCLTLCLHHHQFLSNTMCLQTLYGNNFANNLKIIFVSGNIAEKSNAWYQQMTPMVSHDQQLLEKLLFLPQLQFIHKGLLIFFLAKLHSFLKKIFVVFQITICTDKTGLSSGSI